MPNIAEFSPTGFAKKGLELINPATGQHIVPKYESFCLNYVQFFDRKKAMAAGGYPVDTKTDKQMQTSFRFTMRKPDIQIRVQSLIRAKADELGVGADWVVMKWIELYERCTQGVQVYDRNGDPTGEWRFEARAANDVLDSMAKYFNMFNKGDKSGRPVQVNVNFGGREPPKSVAIDGESVTISE